MIASVAAALIAASLAFYGAWLQRRTGRETVEQSARSADAANRSSQAALEAVAVNRETAIGVAQRAIADALSKRYQEAALQLGHDKAAVRLAGVYAMARLADDWQEARQQCVDVLCAYLRMPSSHETEVGKEGERQVRNSLLEVIGDHLLETRSPNWCECQFDLSFAELDTIKWDDAVFNREPKFGGTLFTGSVLISNVTFNAGASFFNATFQKYFWIQRATINSGQLMLVGSDLGDTILTTDYVAESASINLSSATCRGKVQVSLPFHARTQGKIYLWETLVRRGGELSVTGDDAVEVAPFHRVEIDDKALVLVQEGGAVSLPAPFRSQKDPASEVERWKQVSTN